LNQLENEFEDCFAKLTEVNLISRTQYNNANKFDDRLSNISTGRKLEEKWL